VAPPPLSAWRAAEARFAANRYDGDPTYSSARNGLFVANNSAKTYVIFTAAHAVNHVRDGRSKRADRGTGGLALLLAERTGAAAYVMASRDYGDANYDQSHPLKVALGAAFGPNRAVIDLHGMSGHGGVDVVIGTGGDIRLGGSLAVRAERAFRVNGLSVQIDDHFAAAGPHRIVQYAHRHDVPAIQIELSARLRPPVWDTSLALAALSALTELVDELASEMAVPVAAEPR
jgi:hypothetical protein